MRLKYKELSKLYSLANRLDELGLYKEADALDDIIIKEAGLLDRVKQLKYGPLALGMGLLMPTPIGEQILEPIVQEAPKQVLELVDADFEKIKIKSGDSVWKLARKYFPDIDGETASEIIFKYNPELKDGKLSINQEVKIPKITSLERIGFEKEIGMGLSGSGSITKPSDSLADALRNVEGFEPSIYDTGAGSKDLTVGYGHKLTEEEESKLNQTGKVVIHGVKVTKSGEINKAQAEKIFQGDLNDAIRKVNTKKYKNLSQQQYDALVMFAFNVGNIPSGINSLIWEDRLEEVPAEIEKYHHADGQSYKGLELRRQDEINIWKDGIY